MGNRYNREHEDLKWTGIMSNLHSTDCKNETKHAQKSDLRN